MCDIPFNVIQNPYFIELLEQLGTIYYEANNIDGGYDYDDSNADNKNQNEKKLVNNKINKKKLLENRLEKKGSSLEKN
ncbi:3438_t:CDS:2 [Entrophospora sp. SA101]|nr:8970_t:CDS:2 [Entrophospora sp. SA101]CAJ0638133.1 3438_t:CDS:2 [Entrophospora sp. SA101]